jgi:hypothetical protein
MRYIYCHPLFDERKCAHRFSYQLTRAFEKNNLQLERFDYSGTGEAEGKFCDVTMDSLRENLQKVVDGDRVCIIGTRFGATVAFDYCCQGNLNVHSLVMIEPVINGRGYAEYLFRKQRLKDMMTGNGSNFSQEDGFINLEGFKTSAVFLEQIRQINLFEMQNQIKIKSVFIMQISTSGKVCSEYGLFAGDFRKYGNSACVEVFNLPAFWERIPDGDYTAANEKILELCL